MSGEKKKETGGSKETAAEKAEEITSAFSCRKDQQQLLQPHPLFPQQSRSRMIIQQLSLQQPLLLHPHPLLFPQQHRRQIIQRIQEQLLPPPPNREVPQPLLHPHPLLHPPLHPQLLFPHPESQPHPQSLQFVAAKSLIDKSSRILFTVHHMAGSCPQLQKS